MKKGFGFVEMPNNAEATAAINALNGTGVMGRTIEVTKSEEKKDAPKIQRKPKVKPTAKVEEKDFKVWTRKLFPKKKKDAIVDYPGIEELKKEKLKGGGIKSAKNFKVGSRKKK